MPKIHNQLYLFVIFNLLYFGPDEVDIFDLPDVVLMSYRDNESSSHESIWSLQAQIRQGERQGRT